MTVSRSFRSFDPVSSLELERSESALAMYFVIFAASYAWALVALQSMERGEAPDQLNTRLREILRLLDQTLFLGSERVDLGDVANR
jgi:hypothetical protein